MHYVKSYARAAYLCSTLGDAVQHSYRGSHSIPAGQAQADRSPRVVGVASGTGQPAYPPMSLKNEKIIEAGRQCDEMTRMVERTHSLRLKYP